MLLQSLGVDVTVFFRYIPLRFLDNDMADIIMEEMDKIGIKVVRMGGEIEKVT